MSRTIREARPTDIDEIMKTMDAAKKIMRQSGNMLQWEEGYPSEAVIFIIFAYLHEVIIFLGSLCPKDRLLMMRKNG